jgi:hypothetical protein
MASFKFDGRTRLGKLYLKMKADCKRVVEEAIRTSEFTSRTGNLEDSYGAALYYDGVFLEETLYYKEPTSIVPKRWKGSLVKGHEEMMNYFMSFKPVKKGFTLVLVAAMPYGEILERGGGNLKRKYKVIVGANGLMRRLASEYDGMFGRRRVARTSINVKGI